MRPSPARGRGEHLTVGDADNQTTVQSAPAAQLARSTILVVDDTPQNLSLMSDLMEPHYHVKLAPGGVRALKIVATAPPDLILLDIMMPEMDGFEVCRQIKENPQTRHIPVIFLTAMDRMEDEEKGLLLGAADYVTKPISPPILLARVRNQLALKAATDQLQAQNAELELERNRTRELLVKLKAAADKLLVQNRQMKEAQAATAQASAQAGDHPAATAPTAPIAPTDELRSLGRYQIHKALGKGAMGVVYLGSDPLIGRVVAIKTLTLADHCTAENLAEVKERFFREAESAGNLAHPNIVAVFDAGEAQGLAWIAMEYLQGGDLSAWTRPDNLLPQDTVLAIAEQVAGALGYAHEKGIIHRDIKPANIVYAPETGSVKVADFGIASITGSTAAARRDAGLLLGTPSYMSPEQVAGSAVDGRADLYALGVMLYLLIAGRQPFQADSLEALMSCIVETPPADIRNYVADLPDCLVAILDKALAKQPAQRFQAGAEMAAAIGMCRRSMKVFA